MGRAHGERSKPQARRAHPPAGSTITPRTYADQNGSFATSRLIRSAFAIWRKMPVPGRSWQRCSTTFTSGAGGPTTLGLPATHPPPIQAQRGRSRTPKCAPSDSDSPLAHGKDMSSLYAMYLLQLAPRLAGLGRVRRTPYKKYDNATPTVSRLVIPMIAHRARVVRRYFVFELSIF